ncbi:MAG: hypothetical protein WBV82_20450, partial [Myxococcaceae bacterium]
ARAMDRAARLLRDGAGGRPTLAPDGDADGLAAGVIAWRVLERIGTSPKAVHPGKGEHVHTGSVQRRLREEAPTALVVLDMGSRTGAILEGTSTVVVDHGERSLPVGGHIARRADACPGG